MDTKLSKIRSFLKNDEFDIEHESKMVQSRILSSILKVVEEKNMTQTELSKKTGLKQPFLSELFNLHKKLNMNHIALFQKALEIKLQPPNYYSEERHSEKFYSNEEYMPATTNSIDADKFKGAHFTSGPTDKKIKTENREAYSVIKMISSKGLKEKSDKALK